MHLDGRPQNPLKIFGLVIGKYDFAFIYFLLFTIFAVVLFLEIRQFRITMDQYEDEFKAENDFRLITLFPWLASPFHLSWVGPFCFAAAILFGLFEVAYITLGHLHGSTFLAGEGLSPAVYGYYLGSLGAASFWPAASCCFFTWKDIRYIRARVKP